MHSSQLLGRRSSPDGLRGGWLIHLCLAGPSTERHASHIDRARLSPFGRETLFERLDVNLIFRRNALVNDASLHHSSYRKHGIVGTILDFCHGPHALDVETRLLQSSRKVESHVDVGTLARHRLPYPLIDPVVEGKGTATPGNHRGVGLLKYREAP